VEVLGRWLWLYACYCAAVLVAGGVLSLCYWLVYSLATWCRRVSHGPRA